jgi:hypothetical protein
MKGAITSSAGVGAAQLNANCEKLWRRAAARPPARPFDKPECSKSIDGRIPRSHEGNAREERLAEG